MSSIAPLSNNLHEFYETKLESITIYYVFKSDNILRKTTIETTRGSLRWEEFCDKYYLAHPTNVRTKKCHFELQGTRIAFKSVNLLYDLQEEAKQKRQDNVMEKEKGVVQQQDETVKAQQDVIQQVKMRVKTLKNEVHKMSSSSIKFCTLTPFDMLVDNNNTLYLFARKTLEIVRPIKDCLQTNNKIIADKMKKNTNPTIIRPLLIQRQTSLMSLRKQTNADAFNYFMSMMEYIKEE